MLPSPINITLGNGSIVVATYHGIVYIGNSKINALYTPTFQVCLLSINQLDRSGATATFGNGICTILSPGQLTITGTRTGNLYIVDKPTTAYTSTAVPAAQAPGSKKRKRSKAKEQPSTVTAKSVSESRLWHRRLAHLNPAALRSVIDGFTHDGAMCDVCVQAKHKQKFIRTKVTRTTKPFELVHSDVCGPFATPTLSGNYHYFILFIDD